MRKLGKAKKIAGFSLIELMIAVMLGLFVVGAITAVMISTVTTNSANLNMIRLDQDLRNIMLLMSRDIRRAGSWRDAITDAGLNQNTNPFMDTANDIAPSPTITIISPATSVSASVEESCITFSYDLNNNGVLDTSNPDERFGFRLHDGAIRMRQDGATCTDPATSWGERITDPALLTITALNFAVNATATIIPGSNVQPIASGGTNAQIVVRNVNISVTGQINIGGNQTATRTIEQNIRVRNDRYIPGT